MFNQLLHKPVILGVGFGIILMGGFLIHAWLQPDHHFSHTFLNSAQNKQPTFGAENYRLANGLQVIVIPNHRAPVVTHMVWYKVGAADEQPGQSGIAHFLEHLMFKGSGDLAPGEFSEIIKKLGGRDNAFTSQDYTAYYQTVAVEHLPTVMAMEAGRMHDWHPPLDEVMSERKVILEERNSRIDTNPISQFQEQLRAMHFINHPYAMPVIGWRHEMETLTWDMAKAFHDRYYRPDNAILIVSGDVTGDDVVALANKTYGKIAAPSTQVPSPTWTKTPHMIGTPTLNHSDESIKQAQLYMLFSVPSANQSKKDSLALSLLQDILGGGPTSVLYKKLVIEQKLSPSLSVSYDSASRSDSQFWIHANLRDGAPVQSVQDIILDEIADIAEHGIAQDRLDIAIEKAQNSAIFARDSLETPALIFGTGLTTGSSVADIEYWNHDIQTVTQKDIQSVAKRFLNPNHSNETIMSVGLLSPPAKQYNVTPVINGKTPSAPIAVPVD